MSMEYAKILDVASADTVQPDKRAAYVAIFGLSNFSSAERDANKPFNPLLGETYELTTPDIQSVTEQVSHHPPISAMYAYNRRFKYKWWLNQETKTKFQGRYLDAFQQFNTYVEFENRPEKYEIINPVLSVHNLVVGTMYVDIGGTMKASLITESENDTGYCCTLKFTKKGWFSSGDEYKVEGEVVRTNPGKKSKPIVLWKVQGHWNKQIKIAPVVNGEVDESKWELVFDKPPYPDNWEWQYGMSNF